MNLESTRAGRISQAAGLFWIGWGIGDWIVCIMLGDWPWGLINAITIAMGLYCVLGPGRRMVASARKHKAFMDEHRAYMKRTAWPWN